MVKICCENLKNRCIVLYFNLNTMEDTGVITLSGDWRSTKYPDISGMITFELPKDWKKEKFECKCILEYDEESLYNAGTKTLILEASYMDCGRHGGHRIVSRDKDFSVKQYFTFTFGTTNYEKWTGFGACVYPCDIINIKIKDKDALVQQSVSVSQTAVSVDPVPTLVSMPST